MTVFDISTWQSNDIVSKLVDMNADGVILRLGLTYGGKPELDEKYAMFLEQTREVGLPAGLYYYSKMQSYEMARMEAQFINDKVWQYYGNVAQPKLGVWWDMEDETTKFDGIHEMTMYAVDTLINWGFRNVGIYAGYSYFYDYLDIEDIEQRQIPVWVAHYNSRNLLKEEHPNLNHYGWQFTETYDGNTLDGNEWYKDVR